MAPVRGLRSGLVFAGVALIATCYGLARFAYGLFAPKLADEFSLSSGLAGSIGSGSYVGYCVAIDLSTALTMRWGPRPVAVLAGVLATLGIAVVAVARAPAALAVGVRDRWRCCSSTGGGWRGGCLHWWPPPSRRG